MNADIKEFLILMFVCSFLGHDEINLTPCSGYEFGHGFNCIECKRCHNMRWA